MMLRSVFGKTLDDQRRSSIGWLIGIAALIAFTVGFWPSMEGQTGQFTEMMEQMPEAMRAMMGTTDIASPSGFLSSQLFSFLLPVMIGVLGIGRGADVIAGQEQRGELELVLARPVPRWRLAAEKAAGVLLTVAVITAGTFVMIVLGAAAVDMGVPTGEVVGASVGLGLLGWVLAAVGFAVGAGTGNRGAAIAAGAVFGVACYLAATFGPLVEGLGWLGDISPWSWAFGRDALREGPSLLSGLGLLVLAVAATGVGVWRFDRRDVLT